jgi:hypothetical protein
MSFESLTELSGEGLSMGVKMVGQTSVAVENALAAVEFAKVGL